MTISDERLTQLQRLRRRGGWAKWVVTRKVHRGLDHLDPLRDRFDPTRERHYPADYDELHGYQERFVATARVFELFIQRCVPTLPAVREGEVIAVTVMPWWATPSPWFAIAVGLGLARRGRRIELVWHDIPFPDPSAGEVPQGAEIDRIMRLLARWFPVTRVSALPDAAPEPGDEALLDLLAQHNMFWFNRGGIPTPDDLDLRRRMRESLAIGLPKVRTLYRSGRFASGIVTGGIVGSSGLYLHEGKAVGVPTATFDAGLGATAVDVDGAATQHPDHVQAFAWLSSQDEATRAGAIASGREEYARRRAGLDQDGYQVSVAQEASEAAPGRSILIPLSVVFDQAALGKHHIFPDSADWLVSTITALLEETDDEIVVRQHPSERRTLERSAFDVIALLRERFGSTPQVRLVVAEDPVSTYDLLDASRLVLPFVSTIGIEAAALGKPVVVSGCPYYDVIGYVWSAQSREDYLDIVRRGAREELPMLPDQVDRAWQSYYLSTVCQRVWNSFTPQPPDFWRWVARDPDELFADPDVNDIIDALSGGVPLSVLRHRRNVL